MHWKFHLVLKHWQFRRVFKENLKCTKSHLVLKFTGFHLVLKCTKLQWLAICTFPLVFKCSILEIVSSEMLVFGEWFPRLFTEAMFPWCGRIQCHQYGLLWSAYISLQRQHPGTMWAPGVWHHNQHSLSGHQLCHPKLTLVLGWVLYNRGSQQICHWEDPVRWILWHSLRSSDFLCHTSPHIDQFSQPCWTLVRFQLLETNADMYRFCLGPPFLPKRKGSRFFTGFF